MGRSPYKTIPPMDLNTMCLSLPSLLLFLTLPVNVNSDGQHSREVAPGCDFIWERGVSIKSKPSRVYPMLDMKVKTYGNLGILY